MTTARDARVRQFNRATYELMIKVCGTDSPTDFQRHVERTTGAIISLPTIGNWLGRSPSARGTDPAQLSLEMVWLFCRVAGMTIDEFAATIAGLD